MRTWKAITLALLVAFTAMPGTSHAANILFAFVDDDPPYVPDGQQLAGMLSADGHTVTQRFLDAAIYNDYSSFDQVWVYDLFSDADNGANQMANYQNIATWYNGLTDQNLILDGRIISSAPFWTGAGGFPAEDAWIQNYAAQLDANGGGLVLGTDHNDFQSGINNINNLINIDPFTGFFGQFPTSQAQVDTASPLYVPIGPCVAAPALPCINDNSTTGFAPTGLQPNGQFLTPVAYHGTVSTAFDNAAVSATFSSPTFPAPEPSALFLLGLGLATAVLGRRGRRS
jgi:PEP-CTERM motif